MLKDAYGEGLSRRRNEPWRCRQHGRALRMLPASLVSRTCEKGAAHVWALQKPKTLFLTMLVVSAQGLVGALGGISSADAAGSKPLCPAYAPATAIHLYFESAVRHDARRAEACLVSREARYISARVADPDWEDLAFIQVRKVSLYPASLPEFTRPSSEAMPYEGWVVVVSYSSRYRRYGTRANGHHTEIFLVVRMSKAAPWRIAGFLAFA